MKFFLYDETMMNTKAKITTEKLSAMSDIVSQRPDRRRFFCIQNRINEPYNGKP